MERTRFDAAAIVLLSAATLGGPASASTAGVSEDAVKSAYLYRFAGYVEWPSPRPNPGRFTIAVMEAPQIARELRHLLPTHPIKHEIADVLEVASVAELGTASMVYVRGDSGLLRDVLLAIGTRPVLVVSDQDDGLAEGAALNFVAAEHRIRFEISLAAADRVHLTISSELLAVAIRVQGRSGHAAASLGGRSVRAVARSRHSYAPG
jgi:hypothetical protein